MNLRCEIVVVLKPPSTHMEHITIMADEAHVLTGRGAECPHSSVIAKFAEPNLVSVGGSDNRVLYVYVTFDHFLTFLSKPYISIKSYISGKVYRHSGERKILKKIKLLRRVALTTIIGDLKCDLKHTKPG